MNKKVLIIGAGFGGLGAAALLGKYGYDVTVIEKNSSLGGRARVLTASGFTFDMGPSWYLMPDIFEHFFNIFGKSAKDLLNLKRLDPHYRIFIDGQKQIDIRKDLQINLRTFEKMEKGSEKKIQEYLDISKHIYETAKSKFLYKEFDSFRNFLDKDIMINGPKLQIFSKFDSFVSKYTNNDTIKKILEYTIVFLGGSPKNTPALYALMSHIDFNLGVYYPIGGIGKVVEAISNLALENKVKIITNVSAKKIIIKNGNAIGVETSKKRYFADIVISNADLPFTETILLPKKYQTYPTSYWNTKTIAPSAFILYLGINKKLKNIKHHNLYFAKDWRPHFEDIFKTKKLPGDPSIYICCPSQTDKTVAPKKHENIFVLVPISSGLAITKRDQKDYRDKIIKKLESIFTETIEENIIYEKIYTSEDFKKDYNSYKGTALGLAHTLFQSSIFRPQLKSKKVNNLYYVGQYTQPGIGMPMCLISAEIVANKIRDSIQ